MKVHPPWSPEQIAALNDWQHCGWVHPFTCGNRHKDPRDLIPTRRGWVCMVCGYTQDWAHDFMFTLPPDPRTLWKEKSNDRPSTP